MQTVIAAIEAAGGADDDVVVVGHSLAGLCLPVIASRWPVDRSMAFLRRPGPRPRSDSPRSTWPRTPTR